MAEIVNLNRARKAKKRTEKETRAAANRAKFGRTKAQRENDRAEETARDKALDHARLDDQE